MTQAPSVRPTPTRRAGAVALVTAVVAVLLATVGASPAAAGHVRFPDVPSTHYAYAPVDWGVHEGLTNGVGSTGMFQPARSITRAELITMLWRSEQSPISPHPLPPDVPSTHFAAPAVRWALETGVTTGVGGTANFAPNDLITRAQIVTMMWRSQGYPAASAALLPDVPADHWSAPAVRWAVEEGISYGVGSTGLFWPHRSLTRAEAITFLHRLGTGATATPLPPPPPYDGNHAFIEVGGNGEPARWNACQTVNYHVDYSGAHGHASRVLPQAIGQLQSATGITFQQVGDPYQANFWIYWESPAQNDEFRNNPGVAGYARFAVSGFTSVQIVAAEIVINSSFPAGPSDFGGSNSLGTLLLHELGHTVGLDHVGSTSQVMYPYITAHSTYQGGDRYGLYRVGSRQGCTTPSVAGAALTGGIDAVPDDAEWIIRH